MSSDLRELKRFTRRLQGEKSHFPQEKSGYSRVRRSSIFPRPRDASASAMKLNRSEVVKPSRLPRERRHRSGGGVNTDTHGHTHRAPWCLRRRPDAPCAAGEGMLDLTLRYHNMAP